jgi:Mitochondrial domain of unknown function (DUF1713)
LAALDPWPGTIACRGRGTLWRWRAPRPTEQRMLGMPRCVVSIEGGFVGSVIKKRRKRMAKKKHRKLLRKTRVQRRNKK